MNARRPPSVAVWLLDRFGYTDENPALAGDILEEFQRGRSAAWYWRQAFMAMARGSRRRTRFVRIYWLALLAGFAAELPAGYLLWRLPWFRQLHGVPPTAIAFLLAIALLPLSDWLRERVGGRSERALRRLIWSTGGQLQDRWELAEARAFQAFWIFLVADGIAAYVLRNIPTNTWLAIHFLWLAIVALLMQWELTPAKLGCCAEVSNSRLPSHELSLPVTVSRGRTIVLRPETLVESLFSIGDWRLARSLRKAPLPVLRRAIWLGSARNYQAELLGESPILTLSGLMLLLHEAARYERLDDIAAVPLPGEVDGIEHDVVYVKA